MVTELEGDADGSIEALPESVLDVLPAANVDTDPLHVPVTTVHAGATNDTHESQSLWSSMRLPAAAARSNYSHRYLSR